MAVIKIEYLFEDNNQEQVNVNFKIVSDPPFSKNTEEWTEAQKIAVSFAEMTSQQFAEASSEEASGECCDHGCGCDYNHSHGDVDAQP